MTTNEAKGNVLRAARNAVQAWRHHGPVGAEMQGLQVAFDGYDGAVTTAGAEPQQSKSESAAISAARACSKAWVGTTSIGSQIDTLQTALQAVDDETIATGTDARIAALEKQVADLTAQLAAK